MPIEVVHGSPQTVWVPIKDATTIYVGGIVSLDNSSVADDSGIQMIPQASGASNGSNLDIPLGVCIGTNRKTPLFDTTAKCEYITSPAADDAHDGSSIEYYTQGDIWAKGDCIALAKVAIIDPCTVLRASLFNGAVGTAPTLLTCTTGNANGTAQTSNATQHTPVNGLATIFCRTGANAGAYRITYNVSTTAHTWYTAMRNDTVVGDTFVSVPLRHFGVSYVQIGATYASYVDVGQNAGTSYFVINVLELNLKETGKEYVIFRFDGDNFCQARA